MYRLIPYFNIAFEVYNWLIIARVFLSWMPHSSGNPIFRFIYEITEPVLYPFRRMLSPWRGIDFSPIIALLVLQFVESLIIRLLVSI